MERKIALCVGNWNSDSTLFSWTYAKRYFLRKQRDADGGECLSPLDKLYVVHVTTGGKSRERWDGGGPLLPGLSTALASYPHTIVELEGNTVHSAIREWAGRENIDLLVLGSRDNRNTMQKIVPGTNNIGSTSDIIKSRCKCPCLIVRPASARNERLRIKSEANLGKLINAQAALDGPLCRVGPLQPSMSCAPRALDSEGRKVAFAFESPAYGRLMMAWAVKYCLFPDDEVYVVHCITKSEVKREKKESAVSSSGTATPGAAPDTEELQSRFEELQGFTVNDVVQLRGDPKQELCEFAESAAIDLLISGCSSGSRLRKALTGGSVSTHLTQRAPCPTLVIPQKYFAPPPEFAGALETASSAEPGSSPPEKGRPTGGLALQLSGRLSSLRVHKKGDLAEDAVGPSAGASMVSPPLTPPLANAAHSGGLLGRSGAVSPPPAPGNASARTGVSSDEEGGGGESSAGAAAAPASATRLGSMPNLVHPRSWRRLGSRAHAKDAPELEEDGRRWGNDSLVESLRTQLQMKDLEIKGLKEKINQLEKSIDETWRLKVPTPGPVAQ